MTNEITDQLEVGRFAKKFAIAPCHRNGGAPEVKGGKIENKSNTVALVVDESELEEYKHDFQMLKEEPASLFVKGKHTIVSREDGSTTAFQTKFFEKAEQVFNLDYLEPEHLRVNPNTDLFPVAIADDHDEQYLAIAPIVINR